jgi:hypothetical protein
MLESLKLSSPMTFVGAEAVGRLRHLHHLELAGPLPDSVLRRLPALGGSLRGLALRECCAASSGGLGAALSGLPLLSDADLSSCTQLSDDTLLQLAEGCPALTKLDLTGCELFRWARSSILTLCQGCQAPCQDQTACPLISGALPVPFCSEAGLRHLARLPLRTLVMSACCQLTDGCLAAVAELPQLRCLGLFEAGEGVTDAGLAALTALGGSLTALDLGYSCWAHTAEGLAAIMPALTNLRMLNIGGSCAAGGPAAGLLHGPCKTCQPVHRGDPPCPFLHRGLRGHRRPRGGSGCAPLPPADHAGPEREPARDRWRGAAAGGPAAPARAQPGVEHPTPGRRAGGPAPLADQAGPQVGWLSSLGCLPHTADKRGQAANASHIIVAQISKAAAKAVG